MNLRLTNINTIVGIIGIFVALISFYKVESYKDKLRISEEIKIHNELKYQLERYLNICQEIMQDKISIVYLHNNIINGINVSKNIQYEMQYSISSFPKYASVNISSFKKSIQLKVVSIRAKIDEIKGLQQDIENTFKRFEIYQKNENVNTVKTSLNQLFIELIDVMNIVYKRGLKTQKGVNTINDVLIIDNDNKEIPEELKISLKDDEEFYKTLKENGPKVRLLLDKINPILY